MKPKHEVPEEIKRTRLGFFRDENGRLCQRDYSNLYNVLSRNMCDISRVIKHGIFYQFNLTSLMAEMFPDEVKTKHETRVKTELEKDLEVKDAYYWLLHFGERPLRRMDEESCLVRLFNARVMVSHRKEQSAEPPQTDEEILKEYDEQLDRLSYHRPDKMIPDVDVLNLMSLARQEGEKAGRVFKCACVRGDTSEKICECYKAGMSNALYGIISGRYEVENNNERIASLEKENTELKLSRICPEDCRTCICGKKIASLEEQVEINEQTIQTYEQEKKRDRECIASLESALSQRGNVVNIATKEQVEYVQQLEQQLKIAKQEEREKIKKAGYWPEGEGINQVDYVIEKHEFPHLYGCEGTMCYCGARAKRNGYAYKEGKWVKI